MKVMILGEGYIGQHFNDELIEANEHEAIVMSRVPKTADAYPLDMSDAAAIGDALQHFKPDAVINCAGRKVSDDPPQAFTTYASNVLPQIAKFAPNIRYIGLGSAGELGPVPEAQWPIGEDTPPDPQSLYAAAKVLETAQATRYRDDYGLSIVTARVFNPVGGHGMPAPLLLNRLILRATGSLNEPVKGPYEGKRDYFPVIDLGRALICLATEQPRSGVAEPIYHIGSGVATTNEQLARMVCAASGVSSIGEIMVDAGIPDAYASQADTRLIRRDFDWQPTPIDVIVRQTITALATSDTTSALISSTGGVKP